MFEGLKAHRAVDGHVALFRPDRHGERFDASAARICMPAVGPELFHDAVFTLVGLDQACGATLRRRLALRAADDHRHRAA